MLPTLPFPERHRREYRSAFQRGPDERPLRVVIDRSTIPPGPPLAVLDELTRGEHFDVIGTGESDRFRAVLEGPGTAGVDSVRVVGPDSQSLFSVGESHTIRVSHRGGQIAPRMWSATPDDPVFEVSLETSTYLERLLPLALQAIEKVLYSVSPVTIGAPTSHILRAPHIEEEDFDSAARLRLALLGGIG
jgi:hypothetical protein